MNEIDTLHAIKDGLDQIEHHLDRIATALEPTPEPDPEDMERPAIRSLANHWCPNCGLVGEPQSMNVAESSGPTHLICPACGFSEAIDGQPA